MRILGYILYFSCIFAGTFLSTFLWKGIKIFDIFGLYNQYSLQSAMEDIQWTNKNSMGVATYLWILIDLVVIYFSPFLKFDYKGFNSYYNLYFLGIILAPIIGGTYLDRMNMYFQPVRIVVYAALFYNLWNFKGQYWKYLVISISLVLVAFFYNAIFNKASMCAPFQFV